MKKEDDNIVVNGLANTSQVTISAQFADVEGMIRTAKRMAYSAVNTELIDLYWHIGAYISQRVENATWGKSVVEQLADYTRYQEPNSEGFSK